MRPCNETRLAAVESASENILPLPTSAIVCGNPDDPVRVRCVRAVVTDVQPAGVVFLYLDRRDPADRVNLLKVPVLGDDDGYGKDKCKWSRTAGEPPEGVGQNSPNYDNTIPRPPRTSIAGNAWGSTTSSRPLPSRALTRCRTALRLTSRHDED